MLRHLCAVGAILGSACLSAPERAADPAAAARATPAAPATPAASAAPVAQNPAPSAAAQAQAALQRAFDEQGVRVDLERGVLGLACIVGITYDQIEYLLVGPSGSRHESLLLTTATPSLVNAGLLLLGTERGSDVRWTRREPPPTDAERAAGVKPYTLELPSGDGFYLYVGWRRGEETYLFRAEDLILNVRADTTMDRHRWVYTGSRFVTAKDGREAFAADVVQNLISVIFFPEHDVFATAALPDCVIQTIWYPNYRMLPTEGSNVELFFARQRLVELPPGWAVELPRVGTVAAVPAQLSSEAPVPSQGGQR